MNNSNVYQRDSSIDINYCDKLLVFSCGLKDLILRNIDFEYECIKNNASPAQTFFKVGGALNEGFGA